MLHRLFDELPLLHKKYRNALKTYRNTQKRACSASVTAIEYQGKRILQVEIRNYRERIYITVKNSSPKRNYQEGRSTKSDKENHGYGMKNVHQVVEKYHGSMETKWENDMFITSIEL